MNKPQFHNLKIKDVTRETDEAVSIAFDLNEDQKSAFEFIPGQYLTLKADVNGEDLRRPYSICTSKEDGELRVCVKQVEKGRFSTFANQNLEAGQNIDVMTPMGNFKHEATNAGAQYVGIAGGSGITPILSILKTVLNDDENAQFTLFYGNKSAKSTIFRAAISRLKNRYLNRLSVYHIFSEEEVEAEIFNGLMNQEKIEDLANNLIDAKNITHYYICGPQPMMDGATAALEKIGVESANVSVEQFLAANDGGSLKADAASDAAEVTHDHEVTIIADGEVKNLTMSSDANVLDTGTDALMDLPFACKGGICCTCRAKLVEGEVDMAVTTGLEDHEIEAGFILTCQAKPKSKKIVVNYDIV